MRSSNDVRLAKVKPNLGQDASGEFEIDASIPEEVRRDWAEMRHNIVGLFKPTANVPAPAPRHKPAKNAQKGKKAKRGKKRKADIRDGKGLALTEPLNSFMRLAFAASDTDYTYEL